MSSPVKLLALEEFDRGLPSLQSAASTLGNNLPRDGWVRAIRTSLGMPMRHFARRIGFKEPASVKELEKNELAGTITLRTLRRAADAIGADFVYAIVPRKSLRETLAQRAREVAEARMTPIVKSMALENQGLSDERIARQIDELARELEKKPQRLW